MNTAILFWLLFLLLNSYYFIPRYLLEIFHSQFFPIRMFIHGPTGQRFRHVLIRRNYDVFRICTDLFVLSFAYALVLREYIGPVPYFIFACCYFWASLLYQVYYHAFHRIYHLDPVFFHDFLMLKTAGQIFIHEFSTRNLFIAIAGAMVALSGAMVLYLIIWIGSAVSFGTGSYVLIILIALGSLYSLLHYTYSKYPQLTFQSPLQSFLRNLLISGRSRKSLANLTLKYMKQYNVDPQVRLLEKPNIYFIVVESYGRVALDESSLRKQYVSYIHTLQESLAGEGWKSVSGYSLSPVTGGASWISYTSVMYGLNVRNQGVYLAMMKNKYMAEYDSLFHWLKRQGYITFRISSLGGYEKMEIPYDSYSRLYGIDHWVKYKDLAFTGEHYGFGPSPPDQYSLWKGDEVCSALAGESPKAVFFISQNSHTPYDSPMELAQDWRTLNHNRVLAGKKPSAFWTRPKFEKYGDAIQYQLRYLVDFILKKGNGNDLFMIIGDHQPPSLSIAMENFDTPFHFISKNDNFLNCLREYGLQEGLIPDDKSPTIKQESIHWMLLRSLIRTYGQKEDALPVYLPNGIPY